MPALTSYSESSLIGLMEVELGPTGETLGLLETDALLYAAYAVERLLGVAIASVPAADLAKLETIARWQAWRAAKAAATGEFDLKAGSVTLTRSQTWEHIVVMLAEAEAAASIYTEVQTALAGGSGMAYAGSISTGGDPYPFQTWDEWR